MREAMCVPFVVVDLYSYEVVNTSSVTVFSQATKRVSNLEVLSEAETETEIRNSTQAGKANKILTVFFDDWWHQHCRKCPSPK